MKRLSLFICLILCVTIGGVYATWYYSGAENVADISEPITIALEDAQTVGSHGSYTLEKTLGSTTFFRIDQMDDNHTAGIICDSTMKLVFTPNAHASAEIKNGAFDTWIYFQSNLSTLTYNNQQIFQEIENDSVENGIKITWTVEDGKLVCDITEYLTEAVQLANTFRLDTLADYNAFNEAIGGASITIHVTDGIVAEAAA